MNIKIHSSELNRMMKTVTQCIVPKDTNLENIEISYDDNMLRIRGTNGVMAATMSTPVLGGDGEKFCVDGTMFARVVGMCSGEITIASDERTCTVFGAGRTRIPIVHTNLPEFTGVEGKECDINANELTRGYGSVAYAVSGDQNRVVLTGVLVEIDAENRNTMRMISLDGFKMAVEEVHCDGDDIRVVIPGAFMKLLSSSAGPGEILHIRTDGKRMQVETEGMSVGTVLLSNEFPDYKRIVPQGYKTKSLVGASEILGVLKSGSVVNNTNNLVKLNVAENDITIMSNSEHADFEANVSCITDGDGMKIAFNHKYLMESIASIRESEISMEFNGTVSPCVMRGKDGNGYRLLLPVRVQG